MGGDDQNRRATTKRFTREELAVLANKARGDDPADVVEEPAATPEPVAREITPMSRTQTVHDPMTTQLLAEVARRLHQTIELDPISLSDADAPTDVTKTEHEDTDEVAHPHLRRRR